MTSWGSVTQERARVVMTVPCGCVTGALAGGEEVHSAARRLKSSDDVVVWGGGDLISLFTWWPQTFWGSTSSCGRV